ncbi:MAG: Hsp70 family protein [Kofleriaceae bacterium]
MHVGIDFGTTNSAVAVADDAGTISLVPLAGASYWRTILYFEPGGKLTAGAPAIARYLETGGEGRLVQSIKSHLASATFGKTMILGRRWTLDDMIAAYLRLVRAAAPFELGSRAVIGRPVRYWGATDDEDDARAIGRMREACAKAGFTEVQFQYEPVGAAARYAARLDHQELIVVADYGGGTTDFSVIRAGAGDTSVLATGGLGVSGDAFDARVIDSIVAPELGRGTKYVTDEWGGEALVPAWLYSSLRRWHLLSFLKEESTQRLLTRVVEGAIEPKRIERFIQLVDEDLGLALHGAVEGAKVRLSQADQDKVALRAIELDLPILRDDFEQWIGEDLDAIDVVLTKVLADAGVTADQIDRVFATGGSSLVPAVRNRLRKRFGDRLVGGEELTSVAWGLAALAMRF